jgi:DNA-nicking Smr family endonuclease
MRKPRKPTEEERRLWHHIIRDVAPLRPRPEEAAPPAPAAEPSKGGPTIPEPPPVPDERRPAASPARTRYLRPGDLAAIDGHRADKLRRGKAPIEGRLDLHGMRRDEAHDALVGFLSSAYQAGRRNLLVITGKGTFGTGPGVLRGEVPRWLNEAPLRQIVLAYTEAHPRSGGAGALYIALRRRRDE